MGEGNKTASPMLTAIMSGGVGISGRELYKTLEKVQKMRDLEGPTSFHPFENTR